MSVTCRRRLILLSTKDYLHVDPILGTRSKGDWDSPADLKKAFGINVDFLGDNRAVFDIGGNKYRLVVRFAYKFKSALIKFVGTHAEYDRIDAETV